MLPILGVVKRDMSGYTTARSNAIPTMSPSMRGANLPSRHTIHFVVTLSCSPVVSFAIINCRSRPSVRMKAHTSRSFDDSLALSILQCPGAIAFIVQRITQTVIN